MGGSTKPKRRRAAAPAAGYGGSGGGRPRPARPGRAGRRVRAAGFACLVLLVAVGCVLALALGPLVWAGDLWHEVAPGWPGGGYGFAVTAGLLLPVSLPLFGVPLSRVNWRRDKVRSLSWIALALPGAASAILVVSIAMQTWRPKRSRGGGSCSSFTEHCWISGRYPYVSLVGLAATVVGSALLFAAYAAHDKRRCGAGSKSPIAT
ncbi:hypothetical protein ACIP79_23655 [Streptomyces sp. NPDC088747]|uniref:hypothetical protein n=1 Tax=Streptomyces sp. NPDC088747 TaxID=3365886 RepID=UPI00380F9434